MTIHVKPHLEAVLQAQVDAGNFPDVEAALEAAILALEDAASGNDDIDHEDLDWTKPYIQEGLADAAAGKTHSSEEVRAFIEQRLKAR